MFLLTRAEPSDPHKQSMQAVSRFRNGYCVVPYVGVGTSLTGGGRGAGEGGARGFVLQ